MSQSFRKESPMYNVEDHAEIVFELRKKCYECKGNRVALKDYNQMLKRATPQQIKEVEEWVKSQLAMQQVECCKVDCDVYKALLKAQKEGIMCQGTELSACEFCVRHVDNDPESHGAEACVKCLQFSSHRA